MVDVARLVGMKLRAYEKDGRKQEYCNLHLVYVEGIFRNINGSRVEEVRCPREVDPHRLKVGQLYELEYDRYTFQGKSEQRLSWQPADDSSLWPPLPRGSHRPILSVALTIHTTQHRCATPQMAGSPVPQKAA